MTGRRDAGPRARRPVLLAVLLASAFMTLQVAWVLTVPPFRGIDEFDHAYRAAAVADGQLLPSDRHVVAGRGDYVTVPASLVRAATEVCESYDYTGHDNCRAARTLPDGRVEVASAAARYNPAFYWVIGTAASSFDGASKVYALRIAAGIVCAVLVGAAGYAVGVGSRSRWPLLGLVVATTPVFVYSSAIGAPNGAEMCAGLLLWSAVVALRAPWLTPGEERSLVVLAATAGSVLATTRLLGPVWLLAVVVVSAPLLGRERLGSLVRRHRVATAAAVAAVVAATAAAGWWTLLARPNSLRSGDAVTDLHLPDPVRATLLEVPLWVFQSIAAFPTRSEPAPTLVYDTGLAALAVVLGVALWRLPARWRWWLVGVVGLWVGMQLTVELTGYQHLGPAWQGRYALPFVVGVPLAAGALIEEHGSRHGPPRAVLAVVGVLLAVGHGVSTVHVLRGETRTSPLSGDPAWVAAPAWLLVLLTVVSAGLVVLAGRTFPTERPAVEDAATVEPGRDPRLGDREPVGV